MCSRFEIKAKPEGLKRRFRLKRLPGAIDAALGDAVRHPTDPVLTLTTGTNAEAEARVLRWGLAVDWDTKPLINARAETLTQKPTFRPLLTHRCLVPASAYFEWRKDKATGARFRNRITAIDAEEEDAGLIAFAGLMDEAQNAVTIVTCAPSPAIAHIHGRMPVILRRKDEALWGDPNRSFAEAAPCLLPFPDVAAIEDTAPPPAQADLFG